MPLQAPRPVSVTVFGILNIVFAAFGVFGIVASFAMLSAPLMANNPAIKVMRDSPGYVTWMKISIPIGLMMLAALLIAGIGLLRLKPWARVLSMVYAVAAIVTSLIGSWVNYIFLAHPLLEEAARHPGPEMAGAVGGAVGGVVGSCAGVLYPILLLVFMTRPKVMQAFLPIPFVPAPPAS